MMNCEEKWYWIVRRNREYLCGRNRWTIYRYDAWRTTNETLARDMARATGGIHMLFRPLTGDEKLW